MEVNVNFMRKLKQVITKNMGAFAVSVNFAQMKTSIAFLITYFIVLYDSVHLSVAALYKRKSFDLMQLNLA